MSGEFSRRWCEGFHWGVHRPEGVKRRGTVDEKKGDNLPLTNSYIMRGHGKFRARSKSSPQNNSGGKTI